MATETLNKRLPYHIVNSDGCDAFLESSKPRDGEVTIRYMGDNDIIAHSVTSGTWESAHVEMLSVLEDAGVEV